MRLSTASTVAVAIFSLITEAVHLVDELSIGKNDKIYSENGAIADFHLLGMPSPPEVLSNKIILTPPVPGYSRGALWSDKTMVHAHWSLEVDLRATGPERAGANIQIWYVKDGQQTIGTSSIYTVGKFDGLSLVIDQYAGSGGSIRGFLNDGSINYKSHHDVNSLAFSHCKYAYRNLGRPSRISLSQIDSGFHVTVDGKECFASNKVNLPAGNNIGITAVGAEIPDSVEIFKVITSVDAPTDEKSTPQQKTTQQTIRDDLKDSDSSAKIQDKFSSTAQNFAEQYADLSIRLQSIMKQVNRLHQVSAGYQTQLSGKQDEISEILRKIEAQIGKVDSVTENVQEVQRNARSMNEELHKTLERYFRNLKSDIVGPINESIDIHRNVHDILHKLIRFNKEMIIILIIMTALQAIVILGYFVLERRRRKQTKKLI